MFAIRNPDGSYRLIQGRVQVGHCASNATAFIVLGRRIAKTVWEVLF